MSENNDTMMPAGYREEVARMLDDLEQRVYARLAYQLRSHELRWHDREPFGGPYPLETD